MRSGFSRKRRAGVSSVLATVILITITLVAAVAVAGFVFGTIGTFTSGNAFSNYGVLGGDGNSTTSDTTTTTSSGASVTATPTSCTSASKTKSKCVLDVLNSGSSTVSVLKNSCVIYILGVPVGGTNPTKTIKSGKSSSLTCTVSGAEPPVGSSASGFVSVQGSPSVPFAGVWS
ncbi:MAG TPA: archaellin/type IV pilin N-terminal domain-containing protein [Nitrososphaerales archaeon]|nr:archaellin/type IV pilin N-terminal domain-containing protein [Nitrososphaerales archaeon]